MLLLSASLVGAVADAEATMAAVASTAEGADFSNSLMRQNYVGLTQFFVFFFLFFFCENTVWQLTDRNSHRKWLFAYSLHFVRDTGSACATGGHISNISIRDSSRGME